MTVRAEKVRARLRMRVPGLKKSIGAGDVVKKATSALGMEHCSECERRRERLNRLLRLEATLEEEDESGRTAGSGGRR